MPARGIFLKIYLCFWLAIFLVIAAQVGLDWVSRTGPFRDPPGREFFERTVVPTLMLYGNRAVEHKRSGDAKALQQSAEDLRKRSGMRVVVTDSAGGVLGPGVLAGEIGEIAKSARDSRSSQFSIAKHRALIVLPLSGNDEKDYYVVADVPGFVYDSGPPHGRPGPPPAKRR